jgi:hypothetical protein
VLHKEANLVIFSTAWSTHEAAKPYSRYPHDPDTDLLCHWITRMEPVIRAEMVGEIIFVFANRTGTEDGVVYAGTSAVFGIQAGEVKVYGILGRSDRKLLVVDTNKPPLAKLVSERQPTDQSIQKSSNAPRIPGTVAASPVTPINGEFPRFFDPRGDSPTLPQFLSPRLGLGNQEQVLESSVASLGLGATEPPSVNMSVVDMSKPPTLQITEASHSNRQESPIPTPIEESTYYLVPWSLKSPIVRPLPPKAHPSREMQPALLSQPKRRNSAEW